MEIWELHQILQFVPFLAGKMSLLNVIITLFLVSQPVYPKIAWTGLGYCTDQPGFCGQFQWFQEYTKVDDTHRATRYRVWLVIPEDTEVTEEDIYPIVEDALKNVTNLMNESIWMYEHEHLVKTVTNYASNYGYLSGVTYLSDRDDAEQNLLQPQRYTDGPILVKWAQLTQPLSQLRQYEVTDISKLTKVILTELNHFKEQE